MISTEELSRFQQFVVVILDFIDLQFGTCTEYLTKLTANPLCLQRKCKDISALSLVRYMSVRVFGLRVGGWIFYFFLMQETFIGTSTEDGFFGASAKATSNKRFALRKIYRGVLLELVMRLERSLE